MMEEFCRRRLCSPVEMTSPHLIVFVVTQIPLDNPTSSHDFVVNPVRPPWIRPARKKNPTVPRSIASMESPPQDTSEFASDPISLAPARIPFSLITGVSPVTSTLAQREYSTGTASSSGPLLDGGAGEDDQKLFMPSEELMFILRDTDLDIAGLFPPSAFPGSTNQPDDAPYGEDLARHGSQGSDGMAEFVSGP
jgi:hypothetical protein